MGGCWVTQAFQQLKCGISAGTFLTTAYQIIQCRNSSVSEHQQDNHDNKQQSNATRGVIAPVTAVRPARLYAQEQYDQDNQQNKHFKF